MKARCLGAAFVFVASVSADTIFLRPGGSTNGHVERLENGKVYIVTTPGAKAEEIDVARIRSIEFNLRNTNLGQAPELHLGSDGKQKTIAKAPVQRPPESPDTVVLLGGQRVSCRLSRIDGTYVFCSGRDGKELKYTRQPDVSSIQVAPRP